MEETKQPKSAIEQLRELEEANEERLAGIKLAAALSGNQGYKLDLLEPLFVGPEKVESLHFRPHTMGDLEECADLASLAARLCSLAPKELHGLSSCDWSAVQQVLEGFHLRRAAGGPAQSLPKS